MPRKKVEVEEVEDEPKSFTDVINALIEWLKSRRKRDRAVTKLNEILSEE